MAPAEGSGWAFQCLLPAVISVACRIMRRRRGRCRLSAHGNSGRSDPHPSRLTAARRARLTARVAGLAYLLTIIAGAFEQIVRSRLIVPGDPAATFDEILRSEWLHRLAFAADIVPVYSVVTLLCTRCSGP
jgi:Domain of unknown function (DUF4386)